MVCEHCGRELKDTNFVLTEEDLRRNEYINAKKSSADQAFNLINSMTFKTPEELTAYTKAVLDQQAEADFLNNLFIKEIENRWQLSDISIVDGKVYQHVG